MPRERFNRELTALSRATVILGEQAATAVAEAAKAFTTADLALAVKVDDEDAGINRIERQILDDAASLLALQAPVASDLRRILGISRIAADFERIGDHARDIARTTLRLAGATPVDPQGDLALLADQTQVMLQAGLRALDAEDVDQARAVCTLDNGVDATYAALYRGLLAQMVLDPTISARATHTLFAGHDLERIADKVANVAETLIYMVTGETVELN